MIAPTLWRRAVFLTRKRIESAIPLTANELQADKDKQRAEHAMALRKVEILVGKLRAKSTLDAQNNVQQSEQIKLLKAELVSQREFNVDLDKSLLALNDKMASSGLEIQDLNLQLSTTSAELAARTGQLESLTRIHQDAEKRISDDERRLGEFEQDVGKLTSTVADLREKRRKDQEKVRDMRTESRATAELLKNEKVRSADNEKKYERAVAQKSDVEVKLTRQEKAVSRAKEKELGQKADMQELEQRLADSLGERKTLEKELGDLTLRFNKIAKATDSDEPDKVIAALQVAHAKLELDLKASTAKHDELKKQIAEHSAAASNTKSTPAKSSNGDAALREELAQLAAQVVQMTSMVEGKDSRINALIENAGEDGGGTPSLAARVKALREMADKSAN